MKASTECPTDAVEIASIMVDTSEFCSIHCSNINACAGFSYNTQTGKSFQHDETKAFSNSTDSYIYLRELLHKHQSEIISCHTG